MNRWWWCDNIWCEEEMMMILDVKRSWWCDKMWIDDDDVIRYEVEIMWSDVKRKWWCDQMWSRDVDDVIGSRYDDVINWKQRCCDVRRWIWCYMMTDIAT